MSRRQMVTRMLLVTETPTLTQTSMATLTLMQTVAVSIGGHVRVLTFVHIGIMPGISAGSICVGISRLVPVAVCLVAILVLQMRTRPMSTTRTPRQTAGQMPT